MRTLKLLFVSAMGFCLGMVLAGVGGLSAETYFSFFNKHESSKKIEKFWSDTGLAKSDVESFISNLKCRTGGRYQQACQNALAQILSSNGLKITADGAHLETDQNSARYEEMTEREIFESYEIKNINYDSVISAIYRRTSEAKKAKVSGDLINGFLSVYFDAHSYIVPKDYYLQVSSKVERSKFFIGISYERKNGEFYIQKVAKNSDAETAGLKIGDRVISINGKKLKNLNYYDVSRILRDENLKSFRFYIERNNAKHSLVLDRSYRMLSHAQMNTLGAEGHYNLLTLSKFSRGICDEVKDLLNKAKQTPGRGLILDLRDNPGGQLDEAACVTGLLIGRNKKAYYIEYLNEEMPNEVVLTDQDQVYSGPLVVLINHRSASAAETVAGALQDYKRALLIGRRSFGKGTFQESEPWLLNEKIALFKTQGLYLLPSRNSTQFAGVSPDLELASEGDEKREADYFVSPLMKNTKKYQPLKENEIVQDRFVKNAMTQNCLNSHGSSNFQIEDKFIESSLRTFDCGLVNQKKLSIAESNDKILN